MLSNTAKDEIQVRLYLCFFYLEPYIKYSNPANALGPFSQKVYGVILFADISGFTQLATRLSAEELKHHINEYFTMLIGIITSHNGDVIKFCGDALVILWALDPDCDIKTRKTGALYASLCALQLLLECDSYVRQVEGTDTVVSLRLHCGISCGNVYCMSLGITKHL